MWSDESRFTLFQSDGWLRVRREADAMMHPSCLVPTLQASGGQCYDLGLMQLVSSRFSNIMCPKNEVSWLPEYTEWPGYSINGFFSSLMAWAYSKMTMPGFIGPKLWKSGSGSMRDHFHTWIGHHRVQTLTPLRIFGMCWRRLCAVVRLSHYQYKILVKNTATLDENKSCDMAEVYRMRAVIKAKGGPTKY